MSLPENPKPSSGSRVVVLAALAITVVCTIGLIVSQMRSGPDAKAQQPPAGGEASKEAPKELKEFAAQHLPSWRGQQPELVIVVSGQQHNYEAPCGCTSPQYGGLERRYNVIKQLRDFGLPVVALDLGDIHYPGKFKEQAKLK